MTLWQHFSKHTYLINLIFIEMLTIIIFIINNVATITNTTKITIDNNIPRNFITQEEKMFDKNLMPQMYELKFLTKQFKPRFLRYKLQQQIVNESITTTTVSANQSMADTGEDVNDDGDENEEENVQISTTRPIIEESVESNTESGMNMEHIITTMQTVATTTTTTTTTTTPTVTVTASPSSSIFTMAIGKPFLSTTTTPTNLASLSSSFLPFNLKETFKNFFLTSAAATTIKRRPTNKGFLSLFEIIKFENKPCLVAMANIRPMEGVCYHESECKNLGGISTEPCADGAGVCCIFLTGCGDTMSQLIAYFESPNYPKPMQEMLMCVLIINLKENTQQLRLDFIVFELNRPIDGDCLDDQFTISGHDFNFQVPILCGINSGQHLYVHVMNALNRKVYITISSKTTLGSRIFNMKITQLEQIVAPDGCLQYFTEPEGVLKSFNYDIMGTVVDNKEATYLNNLNYAICIKRLKNFCTIIYKMEHDPYLKNSDDKGQSDFQIVNKDEEGLDLVPEGQAGAGIFNCPDDFIAINQVRLCGERFNDGALNEDFTMNAVIRDITAGPIVMPFRTNHLYVGRGFRLFYKQELCV